MTDIIIGVRLKATSDGSVSSAVRGAAADIETLNAAQTGAAGTAGALANATDKAADAVEHQGAASREAAAAIQQAVDQIIAAARAADGLTTSLAKTSREVEQHGRATTGVGQAAETAAAKIGLQGTAVEYVGRLLTPLVGRTQAATAAQALMADAVMSVSGVLTGALAGGIGIVVGLLGSLALSFFTSKDASDDASKSLEAFAAHQSDIGNYIDVTTGKLKEQNAALIANAALTRQKSIDQNNPKIIGLRDQAFEIATSKAYENALAYALPDGTGADGKPDSDIKAAIESAGGSVDKLSARLRELAKRRPELKETADAVNTLAARATLLWRENEQAGREMRALAGDTTALRDAQKNTADDTTRLIELQSRYATATTAVARARANLQLVELRGTAALKARTLSEADYRKQLDDANIAVNKAEAADKAARETRSSSSRVTREATKNTRELEQANRELERSLDALQKRFDPAGAAADRYGETLKTIAAGVRAGKIDDATAQRYRVGAALEEQNAAAKAVASDPLDLTRGLPDFDKELRASIDDAADAMARQLGVAGRKGGQAFRDEGVDAAQAIAQVFGGKIGGVLGPLLGLASGASTGNFNSVGGKAGGLLTLLGGTSLSTGARTSPFAEGLHEITDGLKTGLKDVFKDVFGDNGLFAASLGKTLGKAAGYGAIGGAAGSLTGSSTGGTIGGAVGGLAAEKFLQSTLGSFAGPIGSIAGGLLGGVFGGLFGGAKKGSATLGVGSDGGLEVSSITGNSSKMKTAASNAGDAVASALNKIAEAFGGAVSGAPSVSIGVRNGDYRVDTSGRGITKVKKGAVDFGDDQAAAIAYATADAIRDGVITGLSDKVASALKSSTNIDDAIAEALKVDQLETLLGGVDGAIGKTFKDLERGIADRNRIAQKYGFDLVKVEEQNAKDRADAFEKVMKDRVGSLQTLLSDLTTGDLAEGTLAEQRQALLAERAKAEQDARAGKDGAADTLAEINRKLVALSRDAYGTAGGEYTSDRASAIQSAQDIINLENARVKAQADAAAATNQKLDTANSLTGETNDLLAEINASLRQIAGGGAAGGGGGSTSGFIDLSRWVELK